MKMERSKGSYKIHTKIINNSNVSNPITPLKSYILQREGSACEVNVSASEWV
jgi:hypothetical protein